MASRRRARQRALQILFLWDARRLPVEDVIGAYYDTLYSEEKIQRDEFVVSLVRGAAEHVAELDAQIARHAEHWRMERMPAVDRNILRLATYEIIYDAEIPKSVAINEAIEIVKKFSTDDSGRFVNGILDKLNKGGEAGAN